MARSLDPAMAASGHVHFQYALISAFSIVLTVLVLLACGFCKRFTKNRSHRLHEVNGSLQRAPTLLTKFKQNQEVFTVNERKTKEGRGNGSFTRSEPEEQANRETGSNGDVIPSQAGQSQAGQKTNANGSADPQRISVQDTTFSLNHRRLPSVPHTTGDNLLIHQLSSNRNSQGDPPGPPLYEELVGGGRSSGGAVAGFFSEDLSVNAHENLNDVEELPANPHVPAENIYSDLDNQSMPNNQGMGPEEAAIADDADTQQVQPSVVTPGEGMELLMDPLTPDVRWRFHSPLESSTENATNNDKKKISDLYSKVKKKVKPTDSVPGPSLEAVTGPDDDPPPPPVPIKLFNTDDFQDFEEPLPPPPPPILEMD